MGRFFYKCLEVDTERDLSVILKTYGFQVLELDFELGIGILKEAYKSFREDKYWQLYCSVYPTMTQETFVDFEGFKKRITGEPVQKTSKEKVLDKVEGILSSMKWKQEEK